jgi:putative Mg2+ transporter-C (MgtC) family protein
MALLHTLFALSVAFVLGTAIGFERQWRQRSAGLRTVVLVAVGAAAFADLGYRLNGNVGATSLIAYVVSGIGFLGAGVILKDGASIRGLNTSATIWASAAVGACAGAHQAPAAIAAALFILAANTLLRPLVEWVNRRPLTDSATEAQYSVHATCLPANVSAVRDLLDEVLTRHKYPISEIETLPQGDDQMELVADLLPTGARVAELEAAVAQLEQSPLVLTATWTAEAAA